MGHFYFRLTQVKIKMLQPQPLNHEYDNMKEKVNIKEAVAMFDSLWSLVTTASNSDDHNLNTIPFTIPSTIPFTELPTSGSPDGDSTDGDDDEWVVVVPPSSSNDYYHRVAASAISYDVHHPVGDSTVGDSSLVGDSSPVGDSTDDKEWVLVDVDESVDIYMVKGGRGGGYGLVYPGLTGDIKYDYTNNNFA